MTPTSWSCSRWIPSGPQPRRLDCAAGGTEESKLHAPELLRFEATNALARSVAAGHLPAAEVTAAWEVITGVPVVLHRLDDGPDVVATAERLERHSAYDAAYVVLAERLGAELWTFDGPLARNAASRGFAARLIEA